MRKIYLSLVLFTLCYFTKSAIAQTSTYTVPGTYTYTATATSLGVDVKGARGGFGYTTYAGGKGGRVQATLTVTPGTVLTVYVGGVGGNACYCGTPAGGVNGAGGGAGGGSGSGGGAGGGGSSDIRIGGVALTNRVVVAAGGGGGAYYCGETGGAGGGATGGNGNYCGSNNTSYNGQGATQLAGGAGATSGGSSGGPGFGGNANPSYYAGGGGGGYYGGGGGYYASGGGGSSYPITGGTNTYASSVTNTGDVQNGAGSVTITVLCSASGAVSGASSVCVGSTTTFSNTTAGTAGTWSTTDVAYATVDASTGVVTGVAAGTATITYNIANPCTALATKTITINPIPSAISGAPSVCSGATTALSASPSGGAWTSSNSAIASVNSSGVVTGGTSTGTATISYTLPAGCAPAMLTVTTNPQPAGITGSSTSVCGTQTISLGDATGGGSWTSSNSSLATVGSTGIVTGVSAGNPVISYSLPSGCFSTRPITVNALGPITGVTSMCIGGNTTLADGASGGVWTSSNTSVVTVGTSSGVVTAAGIGSATVSYSILSTGCTASVPVFVTITPNVYTVSGGGSFCLGGSAHVYLNNSDAGVSYQLYNGAFPVSGATLTGSGIIIDFGLIGTPGTYGVRANDGTSCATTMSGTATIAILPAPTAYTVSGGGGYCSGGTGQHVFLGNSTIGVNYQMFVTTGSGTTPVGTTVMGTGGPLDFGLQTTAGTYTIVGTNATTGCTGNMSGSAAISINLPPAINTVTSTGTGYCTGSGGSVTIGLNGSVPGISYQLRYSGSPLGSAVTGTGTSISFGAQTLAGTYTVVATNTGTGCSSTMAGSASISVFALPTVFSVTGGGNYCSGGTGVTVGINGSTTGVNYQVYYTPSAGPTVTVNPAVAGTSTSLNLGTFTSAGGYTVVATNASTGCVSNMFGSANVVINPLPIQHTVTGGGSLCSGGAGVLIGLSSSTLGINYQLLNGTTVVGALSGTGLPLTFGSYNNAGTYFVQATNTITGCQNNMLGSATVIVTPLPTAYNVTVNGIAGGTGNVCALGTGVHVGLSNAASSTNYQLYINGLASGSPVAGTAGTPIDFGVFTTGGTYTVIATNSFGCTNNMTGSGTIIVNPLPAVYSVTGGGNYCSGSTTGVHIGLSASNVGFNYQLYNGTTPVGPPLSGVGAAIDFGTFTTVGTYTVVASNATTACTINMSGSAIVGVNALPTIFTMSSSGSFCNGGTGWPVSLNGSTGGVSYQLYRGGVATGSPLIGTGAALNFGSQIIAGTYTVVATTPAGCTATMLGSTTVTINSLPAVFLVTGGGGYCPGGTGVHVFLNSSVIGIKYQLYSGFTPMGLAMNGTGGALDFGLQTAPGVNYNVVATNPLTTCSNNMSGSVPVFINPGPALFAVTGGGNYCFGGAGVHVGLAGSTIGVNYQLYTAGLPVGVPLAGTGFALDFGLQTANGIYTVIATSSAYTCVSYMIGSASVSAVPQPTTYTITGGGNHCPGGAGVPVGLNGSDTGISYQLYLASSPTGAAVMGTGSSITFGPQTATGNYVVVATNTHAVCSGIMAGIATVGLFPVPLVYNVTGGGNYCPAGSGMHIGLDGSSAGVVYQLYNGSATVGSPVAGSGLPIDFGSQTATGTYTVTAVSTSTGCPNNMAGSATIMLYPLPTSYNVTGGGNYCTGTSGLHIGLDGSDIGTNYQLFRGGVGLGTPVAGTNSSIDLGVQTTAGTYTIVATNTTTGCTKTMSGSATIVINPLPFTYSVTGGGNYCSGGTGVTVGLGGSQSGTIYQLYNGILPVGAPVGGSGTSITFGPQTLGGVYTVVATTSATGCTKTMTGSVSVVINPLPTAYSVTGGGNYCPGGSGVLVGLGGSDNGISYQLSLNGSPTGAPVAGNGSPISFGMQAGTGTYTIRATNILTGCEYDMTGSVGVGISPLPATFMFASATSNYCAGGTGVDLVLTGSEVGTTYQLYVAGTPVGAAVSGTGYILDMGLQTLPGTYTVIATNSTTTCSKLMPGTSTITINPLPTPYSVVGGGNYCQGGPGVHVGLSNSHTGVTYQLYQGASMVGTPVSGTGFAIDFGPQTVAGPYTVIATSTATTCVNNMSGAALVTIDPLPTMYTVTGGGNYCASGAGVHVGLSSSNTGIIYQLFRDGTLVGGSASGSGAALDFGLQTTAGTYTIVATNTVTGCISTMAGNAVVVVNPLPISYVLTGGGNRCPGAAGLDISLVGSELGVTYQLMNGSLGVGSPKAGTGAALSFGLQTASGSYTVVATNTSTMCTNNMSGTVTIVINPLPVVHHVTGGGNFCADAAGVHVGLDASETDISYQLFRVATPLSSVTGTGSAIDYGLITTAGVYSVVATDIITGCTSNMSGTATVVVNPLVVPTVTLSSGTGDTTCSGNLVALTALVSNQGSTPVYHWTVNGVPVAAVGTNYTYMPSNGDNVTVTLTSNATCATPATVSSSVDLTVLTHGTPTVSITNDPGDTVCQGTLVNFNAATTFGGTPTYSWFVNGVDLGASSSFAYVPADGDVVYCFINSTYECRSANSATSNHILMSVDVPTMPDVAVTAHPGATVGKGQTVLLSATLNNNVSDPTYQWFINGTAATGATGPTLTANNFSDMDSVSCMVTSGGVCAGQVGSGWVILHVATNVGVQQVAATSSDVVLIPNPNKGIFTLKGTLGTTDNQEVSVEVTNMLGQVIYTNKIMVHGGNMNEKIQLNTVANGMYLLNLHSATENKVFHIVVEQ